jgi:hypothetical protein
MIVESAPLQNNIIQTTDKQCCLIKQNYGENDPGIYYLYANGEAKRLIIDGIANIAHYPFEKLYRVFSDDIDRFSTFQYSSGFIFISSMNSLGMCIIETINRK